jgi:hypothetical protein
MGGRIETMDHLIDKEPMTLSVSDTTLPAGDEDNRGEAAQLSFSRKLIVPPPRIQLYRFPKVISEKVATPCRASWQTSRFALPIWKLLLEIALVAR